MANIILVEGRTGTGKTRSICTLNPAETFLISITPKELSFPKWKSMYRVSSAGYQGNRKIIYDRAFNSQAYNADKKLFTSITKTVCDTLNSISDKLPNVKTIVLDDTQYLMAFEFMSKAREKGYDKYNEIAQNFFDILTTAQSLREDLDVFFLHHTELDNGIQKAKTLGKMIDNVLTLEGLFTVVLLADSRKADGKIEYYFTTNSDGTSTAKSPEGMFPSEIPNDLQLVKSTIHKYNLGA